MMSVRRIFHVSFRFWKSNGSEGWADMMFAAESCPGTVVGADEWLAR
jgi:hypothetical protein